MTDLAAGASTPRPVRELAAFVDECTAAEATLARVPDDAWHRPALGTWDVAQLVAHLVRGVSRVAEFRNQPAEGPPVQDRLTYWREVPGRAPAVAQRAVDEAAASSPAGLRAAFGPAWHASADVARAKGPDALIAALGGVMRLDEYLATRVLEVVIHHMDLRVALDQPPAPTPDAGRLVMELLEGLLGSPRPRNLGRVRFLQAATGRIATDDPRFPVLR